MSATLIACRASVAPSATATVKPQYNSQTGRLEQLDFDRNADGQLEGRAYMDGAIVRRIQIDANRDGHPDRWEFYGSPERSAGNGRAVRSGVIVRAEQSTRHDGTVSRWEYYDNGVIVRVEEDVDGDGRVDKWERYADGVLAVVELDLSRTGRPDHRLSYRPDGTLLRIEVDESRDGHFDAVP